MSQVQGEDATALRWTKKAWSHLGNLSREETIDLLRDKVVSQKRRMLVKDCVRIIYYCQVQRSTGCKYEMSLCVPLNPEEKVSLSFCSHSLELPVPRKTHAVFSQEIRHTNV